MEEYIDTSEGAKILSRLGRNAGYSQVQKDEGPKDNTSLVTYDRLFRYKRMLFHLRDTPQRINVHLIL